MSRNPIKVFLLSVVSLPFLTGCYAVIGHRHPSPSPDQHPRSERNVCGPGGPPPWAPAHGHRRKCRYRYYPNVEIYYSISAEVYFWQENGKWHSGHSLPTWVSVEGSDHVELELKTDKPYEKHDEIKQEYGPRNEGPGSRGNGNRGKGGPPGSPGKDKKEKTGPPFGHDNDT